MVEGKLPIKAKVGGRAAKPRSAPIVSAPATFPKETAPAAPPAMIEAVTSPAMDSDPIPAPAQSGPVSEGISTMATITTPSEVSDKAQALFGDVSTRIKAAVEKSSKMNEEIADFAKGNVEAMVASARVAAKGSEAIAQEAADYGKKSLESATALFKSFATIKSPTELFQLQSDFAKAAFDTAVAEASKVSESMMKLAGDVAQPLSNRYSIAAEKFKPTAL